MTGCAALLWPSRTLRTGLGLGLGLGIGLGLGLGLRLGLGLGLGLGLVLGLGFGLSVLLDTNYKPLFLLPGWKPAVISYY